MGVFSGIFAVDRSKVAFDVGARCAVGVAITLVAGELAGHPDIGVTAAIGAISGGFASMQGAYRTRAGAVVAAAIGMAAAAFVGGTVGHLLGVYVVVAAALGFVSGLLVALGQAATVVGVQSVVGLVVFSQFRFDTVTALREAGFVLAGGLVQLLLVVVVWPLRRFPAERRALGNAYSKLSEYARSLVVDPSGLLAPDAFVQLAEVMSDPQPFAGAEAVAAHRALVSQAERIRLELAALGRGRQRLLDHASLEGRTFAVDDVLEASSSVLEEVASALREARVPTRWEDERHRFEGALERLNRDAGPGSSSAGTNATVAAVARQCEALAGQLRAVLRIAAVPSGGDPVALEEAAVTGRPIRSERGGLLRGEANWAGEQVATLRANLALSSEAFRHGIRVAGALGVAVALSSAFQQGHRYWLPMTAMIVLKPDFASTFTRGLSRVLGTLVGAGLVTVAVAELRPGHAGLTAMVLFFYFAALALLLANYAMFSVCIGSLVVTLIAFTGQPELSVAGDRSLYTALGAAVALVAYGVWPTWAAASLRDRLSELVVMEAGYGKAVLEAWADPAEADRGGLERARLSARLARSNTEAVVERWLSEPSRSEPVSRQTVLGVMAAVRAYVQAILALHAGLPEGSIPDVRPNPEEREAQKAALCELAQEVGQALESAARVIAGGRPAGPLDELPPLRATQLRLMRGTDRTAPAATGDLDRTRLLLVGETDLVVNSVNTIGHLVGLARSG